MNIQEKQARWNKERPLFEADFIHSHLLPFFNFNENTGDYEIKSEFAEDEDRNVAFETLNTGWAMWLRAKRGSKAEIDELKAKLEATQATKETYFLRDADYVVDDLCDYCLEPSLGDVFEFEKWKRTKEEKIYIVPIFKNEDDYEFVEFSSEDEADKAAAENKAMIEAAQGEGHESE